MNKEKVLSYLNLKIEAPIDKSLPKICGGFSIGFSVLVVLILIVSNPSQIIIPFGIFIAFDILYFIVIARYKNPFMQFPVSFIGLLAIIIKLFYGYSISSKYELMKYGMSDINFFHILVMVLSIVIISYLLSKFYVAYKILKENSIEIAQKKISKSNPMPKWAAIISSLVGSPMIFVRLLKDDMQELDLGLGFCMWSLGWIFIIFLVGFVPKCYVLIRYKAWKFLKDEKN